MLLVRQHATIARTAVQLWDPKMAKRALHGC